MYASNILHNVLFDLPLFISPFLLMQFRDFHNVWLTSHQYLFLIFSSDASWFAVCYSRLLLMVFDQRICSILCRQLFINTHDILVIVVLVHQGLAPYSGSVSMFALKILTKVLVDSLFEFQMFFSCKNAVLPLVVRGLAVSPTLSSHLNVLKSVITVVFLFI